MRTAGEIPLIRLLLPYSAGIIIAISNDFYKTGALYILFIPVSLFIFCLIFKQIPSLRRWKHRWVFGLSCYLCLFSAGFFLVSVKHDLNNPSHFNDLDIGTKAMLVKITEPPTEMPNSIRLFCNVAGIKDSLNWYQAEGHMIVYLQKDSFSSGLKYGDLVLCYGSPQIITPPLNPHEFNYKRHLANMGIFSQLYCPSRAWRKTGINEGNPLLIPIYSIRERLINILKNSSLHQQEFAVASALLLGHREALDQELLQSFSASGAIHIICVSGLHVGIVYLVFSVCFSFMDKNAFLRILRTILTIMSIWLYAAITGFSPSTNRAAIMFSFMALGCIFERQTNSYNTLAASAFLLLFINPFVITKVGFQLSYLAVLGIITFQPPLAKLLVFKNKLASYIWGIITVSLAAQLATAPLSVYYFNQFPNFFLLTNLVAIPLTSIILYTGIAFFTLSFIPLLSQLLSSCLYLLIKTLNNSVIFVEGIPFSLSHDLYISTLALLFISAGIVSLAFFIQLKNNKWAYMMLACFIVASADSLVHKYKTLAQEKIIVYHTRQGTSIDVINGSQSFLITDSLIHTNPSLIGYQIDKNKIANNISMQTVYDYKGSANKQPYFRLYNGLLQASNTTLLILMPEHKQLSSHQPIDVDFVIINRKSKMKAEILAPRIRFKTLILDASLTNWYHQYWKTKCEENHWDYWSIKDKGFFEIPLGTN